MSLASRRPALHKLTSAVVSADADRELAILAGDLADMVAAPIAIVSVVLERVQLVRGHHGLPPELAAARAIDREASFCRQVVDDDAVLEVADTHAHGERVPELLVRHGLRSYLGAPVHVDGYPVGVVCILDRAPRPFGPAEREAVLAAAARAGARFGHLAAAAAGPDGSLHDRAVRPQFAELRNRMQPMVGGVQSMQVALAELQAVLRLAAYVATHPEEASTVLPLQSAEEAIEELEACLGDLADSARAVQRAVTALESASLVTSETCTVRALVDASTTLAHHHTKLVGGVRWSTPEPSVTFPVPLQVAVNTVAAGLSGLSGAVHRVRGRRGLDAEVARAHDGVRVRLSAPDLDPATLAISAAALAGLVGEAHAVAVRDLGTGVELLFTAA